MNKYKITTMKKKKSIVDAALFLFQKNGFTDVSIKEIASAAKVSQVSIYNYFSSKEALVAECAKVVIEDTLRKASEILEMDIPFLEKLNKALHVCNESINVSISKHFTDTALSDPILSDLLKKEIDISKINIYRQYIERGKSEGVICDKVSTNTILAFMNSLNQIGSISGENQMTEKEVEEIHHLFLFGIIGKLNS